MAQNQTLNNDINGYVERKGIMDGKFGNKS